MIHPDVWESEVCKGLDATYVAKVLMAHKLLLGAKPKHPAPQVRIPGFGKPRLYRVSGEIVGSVIGGESDDAE
jgi:hypothetical protein